jgi:hypothetical protein
MDLVAARANQLAWLPKQQLVRLTLSEVFAGCVLLLKLQGVFQAITFGSRFKRQTIIRLPPPPPPAIAEAGQNDKRPPIVTIQLLARQF